ncbi:MAG TPA: LacI family DNA-binding transcriptional regulator [Ignavibacteriales bacterium]|nr:LacI family DNA-binding transcriptional regulator [Ignavibacteriales bacterium]
MKEKANSMKKYEALREELLEFIQKNGLKQNDQLPKVRDIIQNIGYSYATVNRTLIEMEKEGLITKRQGKGLYVNRIYPKQKNKQVALIIPKDFSIHRIFLDILSGVRKALEKEHIGLLVSISNMSHEKEKETVENLMSHNVDGMIIFLEDHYRDDFSHIVELKNNKFPFVLIDRFIENLDTDYVIINNRDAMFRVCSYLKYNRHCDKIIFVPANDTSVLVSSSDEKLMGYKEALHVLYGNDQGIILPLEEFIENLNAISSSHKNIGVCLNHDTMIPDMHKRLQELNLKIPPNCHIFGYNNSYDQPYYPTVEQFNDLAGMKAAEILIEKMKNPDAPSVRVRLEPKLILPDQKGGYYMED